MRSVSQIRSERRQVAEIVKGVRSGQYRRGELFMTPDHSVVWDTHDLPENRGLLVIPKDCKTKVLKRLARAALQPARVVPRSARQGEHGGVKFKRNVAYKTFLVGTEAKHSGIPALQANITMREGYRRLGPAARLGWFSVRVPEQLGALMGPLLMGTSVWAMARARGIRGDRSRSRELSNDYDMEYARVNLAKKAAKAAGAASDTIAFDVKPANHVVNWLRFGLACLDFYADSNGTSSVVPGTEAVLNSRMLSKTTVEWTRGSI